MRSRSNRLIPAILVTSLAVLLTVVTPNAHAGEPKAEQCLDPVICPIPYVRLSTQETEPFLFIGKPVDEKHPRYQDYDRALRRFPNVRSCLIEAERKKPRLDLRQINWGAVRNIRDIDVCVFRIASSIEDVETIKVWLRFHDFSVHGPAQRVSKKYVPKYERYPIYYLSANLSTERFRMILPRSWFAKLIGFELMHSYSLSIQFSWNWKVVEVSSIGNSKLN